MECMRQKIMGEEQKVSRCLESMQPRHLAKLKQWHSHMLLITLLWCLPGLQPWAAENPSFRAQGDKVRMSKGRLLKRTVSDYNYEIIKLALERTTDDYGPFTLTQFPTRVSDLRALYELSKPNLDGVIDVHVAITSEEREELTRAIKIPIRFALLSYRLVLVRQENLDKFSKINSLEQLRRFSTGSGENWITTEVLNQHHFQVSYIQQTDSIFKMLGRDRFDFILRGVNELFFEQDLHAEDFKNLAIVPGIAVYMPTHYYAFVNKNNTRLAKRIEAGLQKAFEDGSAREAFWRYYGPSINKAKLNGRRIISIENQNFIDKAVTQKTQYWYAHDDGVERLIKSYARTATSPQEKDFQDSESTHSTSQDISERR